MIIPAIDLIDGNVVRLYQGDYQQQTHFALDPLGQLKCYQDQGATWLHLVDLSGARNPNACQHQLISNLAQELTAKIQVGGGIRTEEQITTLLSSGISRVVIGSLAVKQPELVANWLTQYGSDVISLALDVNIDANGNKMVAVSGWQNTGGKSLEALVEYYADYGLKHALVTDISRDGTMEGANTSLYHEIADKFPDIHWQGSGGIASLKDVAAVKRSGATSIIIGKALLTEQFTVKHAIECWQQS